MSAPNLYKALGLDKSADESEIKKAYKKLALVHHPDKGGDPEEFKKIQEAYAIVSDPEKRRMYDMTGQLPGAAEQGGGGFPFGGFPGFPGFGPGGQVDINEIFGMFGRASQGPIPTRIERHGKVPSKITAIPFTQKDFYNGRKLEISCDRRRYCGSCKGRGSKVFNPCSPCGGTGHVTQIRRMGPMVIQQDGACPVCSGKGVSKGENCNDCGGSCFKNESKNIELHVKPGTKVGTKFTFPCEGSDEEPYSEAGDVILEVVEADEESQFLRIGEDMRAMIHITLTQALTGTIIVIKDHPGYNDGFNARIPAGVQNGSTVVFKGVGFIKEDGVSKGNVYVTVNVRTTADERTILEKHKIMIESIFNVSARENTIDNVLDGVIEGL